MQDAYYPATSSPTKSFSPTKPAFKLYAASPKKDLNKLNTYVKKMRVANALRQHLEVLL